MVFGADPTRRGVACRYCPEARPQPRPANETDACALKFMPKNPPPPEDTGPMGMQPLAHSPTAATQMQPLMPGTEPELVYCQNDQVENPVGSTPGFDPAR